MTLTHARTPSGPAEYMANKLRGLVVVHRTVCVAQGAIELTYAALKAHLDRIDGGVRSSGSGDTRGSIESRCLA